jgi:hypothetical protein
MKYVIRYAALAMAMLSGTVFLSVVLRLLRTYYFTQHSFAAPVRVGPSETLLVGIICVAFSRIYQLLGRSKSNAISGIQTEIELAHVGFMMAWFCLLFTVHKMNPPQRNVSALILLVIAVVGVSVIVFGFVMRKKFFKMSSEAFSSDARKASELWKSANLISFCFALNPPIYGVVLKILGSGWLVPGILFGLGLGFLLLWRPRQLAVSDVQPV